MREILQEGWNFFLESLSVSTMAEISNFIGMQFEVSKYTEGVIEKALWPNGLPQSFLRYNAVETVKHSRQSTNQQVTSVTIEKEKPNLGTMLTVSSGPESFNIPQKILRVMDFANILSKKLPPSQKR